MWIKLCNNVYELDFDTTYQNWLDDYIIRKRQKKPYISILRKSDNQLIWWYCFWDFRPELIKKIIFNKELILIK